MAEPTLTQTFTNIRSEVGQFLGYGRTAGSWSSGQQAQIDACIKSGVLQFYTPPPIGNERAPHQWSWLRPATTLVTSAPYSTGTVTVTNNSTTVTGSGTVFPSWAASGVIKVGGSTLYSIATRGGDTSLTLDTAWTGDTASAQTYEVSQWDYDLPDSFGQIVGPMTYQPALLYPAVMITGEGIIRQYRQNHAGGTGRPAQAAIRAKAIAASATVGQRFEIMFDVAPDAAYVLNYRYQILPDVLTTSNEFAYGGTMYSEALLESCLAVAELRLNDTIGVHHAAFMSRLAAAIGLDRAGGPDHLPYNGDGSDGVEGVSRRADTRLVTVNGAIVT